ncbi:2TM domain-containing protein [Pricia sp.]|uniref:2TM domain-containing protein n=1 Tax=Pricia sp. TaxID=2268138 RepID=UPI0035942FBE
MENTHKENKYLRAKERVEETRKFYTGLMSYAVVISLLAGLNYYIDQWDYPWFLWAAFGWGIGLAFQAAKAFNLNPFFGRSWEERKIKEFMQEDERKARWE